MYIRVHVRLIAYAYGSDLLLRILIVMEFLELWANTIMTITKAKKKVQWNLTIKTTSKLVTGVTNMTSHQF